MIRKATIEDKPALKAMANRFIQYAPSCRFVPHTQHDIDATIDMMFGLDDGVGFVMEENGIAVGMLVAIITSAWYSPSIRIAHELCWWVDEDHRRGIGGLWLIKAYEEWAIDRGAHIISMCDLVIDGQPPVGAYLERLGYFLTERTYIKGAK